MDTKENQNARKESEKKNKFGYRISLAAAIYMVATIFGALFISNLLDSPIILFVFVIMGVFQVLLLFGFSEILHLLQDIKNNTDNDKEKKAETISEE